VAIPTVLQQSRKSCPSALRAAVLSKQTRQPGVHLSVGCWVQSCVWKEVRSYHNVVWPPAHACVWVAGCKVVSGRRCVAITMWCGLLRMLACGLLDAKLCLEGGMYNDVMRTCTRTVCMHERDVTTTPHVTTFSLHLDYVLTPALGLVLHCGLRTGTPLRHKHQTIMTLPRSNYHPSQHPPSSSSSSHCHRDRH
jgi:hypothetical protein